MRQGVTRPLILSASFLAASTLGLWGQAMPAPAQPKVEAPADCPHCGMDRTKFSRSRVRVVYADGAATGTCSVHCLVTELAAAPARTASMIQVGDYGVAGNPLIDARTATWVIGGSVRGVMTPVAKWAFSTPAAAQDFIARNGGSLATFDQVMEAARQDPRKKH